MYTDTIAPIGNDFSRAEHNHASAYADRFRQGILDGNDQLIWDLSQELNHPEATGFTMLVWTKLASYERRSIKESLEDMRKSKFLVRSA